MVSGTQVEGVWGKLGMGVYLVLSQISEEIFYVMAVYHGASVRTPTKSEP